MKPRIVRGTARLHRAGGALAAAAGAAVLFVPSARAAGEAPAGAAGKIASVQNQVETKPGAAPGWTPSTLHQVLFERDRVRTGAASRAAILYSDQTLHRLNEKSEIEILPPAAGSPGLLRVISGQHYFSSRTPKDYGRIETPTVTAAIKGTEFVVDVAEDTTTTITMLEGVVEAKNPYGTLVVQRGEQAYVEPGKAPVRRIVVRPRDAVAWALYYPPVLGGTDRERVRAMGPEGEDLVRAAELLSAGQVESARSLIEAARARRPKDPVSLALASVIEVAANRNEEALRLAEEAAAADPRSASAALALSFAAQASFDIARARAMAEKAAELDPQSSIALARAAELRMAEGDLEGARRAAEGAVQRASEPRESAPRDPGQARALAVLGFVELAQLRTKESEKQFEDAISADPALSLAHLGLGIARIRRGRVDDGREELQTAVALDPDDSLLRSYLGKSYYEEKRSVEAGRELEAAKELDPADPTPHLYDAIRKQNENRPVEALYDLRESIALNDRRAVYRSRLLLDQDRAVRGTDLARIYNDVGFEQLGLVTARRSADEDQANYSSHLFLSGNYRSLSGFAPAFLSEVLQARIYQPVSVNAARPDVVNETISFNEYTALFDRPRARAFGSLSYGQTNTDLSGLFGNISSFDRFLLDRLELDSSDTGAGQVVGTLNGDRFAAALGYSKVSDAGFRTNSDRTIANYRGFFEFSPTYRDSFQVNALYGRQDTGDLPIRGILTSFTDERFDSDLKNLGLGYHRILAPGADLAVSAIYNRTEQTRTTPSSPAGATGILEGPQLEIQQVLRRRRATWIFGAGGFDGEVRLEAPGVGLRSADTFLNGYAYAKLRSLGPLEVTVGASAEHVVSPSGLFTPRDAGVNAAEIEFRETRVSPKAGLSLYLGPKTTLRAAGYYRLSPALGRIQTLEPTQVSGFNQFFGEPGGTRSLSYGAGLDQELCPHLFAGLSILRRDLKIPEPSCESPDQFGGCAGQTVTQIVRRESHDTRGSGYLNAAIGKRLTAAVEYSYERREFDFTMVDQVAFFEDRLETRRLHPQARLFLPFGLFAAAGATYYDQKVYKFEDLRHENDRNIARARFTTVDVLIGYRLPRRYGSIVLDAKNVTDREFELFERAVEDTVVPARVVTLTGSFTF